MTTMRLYRLSRRHDGVKLIMTDAPVPEPGLGEVRVRIEAVSLNYRDLLVLDGASRNGLDGRIPLSDGAGHIDALGSGATRWREGDRVVTSFFRDWISGPFHSRYMLSALGGNATDGVLAEFIVLPEAALAATPDHLSSVEAATLPCAAVTAWQALFVRSTLGAHDTLLVQGTGGVALFGLQFAKAVGARVIVISSSDDKLARAKAMGAEILINYRTTPDWDRAVLEQTDGVGASRILELVGPDTYQRSINALAAGGKIAQIGVLTGFGPKPDLGRLQSMNADIIGITAGSRDHLEAMNAFIVEHRLRPVIDRTFPFDAVPEAYEHIRSGQHFGKVAINV
jgi:NADPH:quinone reductase-like Zn-dependent oxidoreductase